MVKRKDLFFIFRYYFLSRLIIFLLSIAAINLFSFNPTYPYWQSDLQPYASRYVWSWGAFDGAHYIRLARDGYKSAFTEAFFPFYPFIIRLLNILVDNYLIAGLLISNICFILFLVILYKILKKQFCIEVAQETIKLYVFFPTSFLLNSLYTEPLFLLLTILSFYFLINRKWLFSSLFSGLSTATRLVGISVGGAIIAKWLKEYKINNIKILIRGIVYSCTSFLGIFFYMFFLNNKFAYPFAFFNAMALWQKDKPVFFFQTFFRYLKMLFDFSLPFETYFVVLFEFITALLFLYLFIIGFSKLKIYYIVYSFIAFILSISSGTFSSLPRYVLSLFPLFVVLAILLNKNKKLKCIYYIFSTLFLTISVILFIKGNFIA